MRIYRLSAILALLLPTLGTAFAQEALSNERSGQIARINQAITQKHARWIAGETSVSRQSDADWQYLVGLDFQPIKAEPLDDSSEKAYLPPVFDWLYNNGNFVSGVRHQGKCGSCWSFAMTAALESYVLIARRTPNRDINLSEQVMLSCSGAGSCKGGLLNADYLKTTGLPPDSFFPYNGTDSSCSGAAPGWQNSAYKIGGWGGVTKNINSIKAALVKYGPLPTALMVYEDFMHYKGGIYSSVSGKKIGGHAVLLVGYNDIEQYFVVKNSWGTDWGENGFFRIAYSEMNNKISFGLSTIAYHTDKPRAE